MSSRFKLFVFGAVTLFALAIYVFFSGGEGAPSANAQGGPGGMPPPPPVTTMTVQPQHVEVWNEYSSRLVAVDRAEIRPRVAGTITKVHFKDGDMVEEGDSLFTIDVRPYRAAMAQANALLVAANNDLKLKKIELERAEKLIESRAIPQRIYDERVNAYNVAKATREGAYATLESARLNVEYANVEAPISGRTGRVELTEGNVVVNGVNAPLLTTIVANDFIYADFDVDEASYVALVRNGLIRSDASLPVQLFLSGSNLADYEGEIFNFDNRIDTGTGTIRARAKFANDDGALIPGMFVRVAMQSVGGGEQIVVPERAIGTDQNRKFVYLVNNQGMSEYREVNIGASTEGGRIVLNGLNAGDTIITEGIVRIRPGMPVNTGQAPMYAPPPAAQVQEEVAKPLLEEAVETVEQVEGEQEEDVEGESRFLDSSGAVVEKNASIDDQQQTESAQ